MSGPERHKNWFSTLLNATTSARPKRRLKDKIKMNFGEVGCEDGRQMALAQDHVQWQALALNLQVLLP